MMKRLLYPLQDHLRSAHDMDKSTLLQRAAEIKRLFHSVEGHCLICNTAIEVQGHHLYPRHLGGPADGPLVPLCSKDHLMIHHLTGKQSTIPAGFTPAQLRIIKLLVSFINRAKLVYEDVDPTLIDRKIIVTLPDALLKRAHKRKKDIGFTNLQDYILLLVTRDTQSL